MSRPCSDAAAAVDAAPRLSPRAFCRSAADMLWRDKLRGASPAMATFLADAVLVVGVFAVLAVM